MSNEPLIRNVSDTARWAAMYRARESERPDAVFRDPFAGRLAGERGKQIFEQMPGRDTSWAWVARTWLFDRLILAAVDEGFDMVVNLAAGLDARPYRLALPPTLQWVEVDLPAILAEKEEALRGETPSCRLERVPLDLANVAERQRLFARLGSSARRALVITEGLLIYLEREEAMTLARDLATPSSFRRWVLDISSPGLLKILQKTWGKPLEGGNSPLKFGPPEGPAFFEPAGWKAVEVNTTLHAAAKIKRLPFFLRFFALFPEPKGPQGNRPWAGACLLERSGGSAAGDTVGVTALP